MDQLEFTPTRRRTADRHMTPLGATAALYCQGNQRWATFPSQQSTPSTEVRTWPRPCWWSPLCHVPTPTHSHPCLPLTRHSLWARTPAPRASWAWGRVSCSATKARASAMRNNNHRHHAWQVSRTAWRLTCAWNHPAQLISPPWARHLPPSPPHPLPQHLPLLLLSLCPPRSTPLSPSSEPPARKVPAERQGWGKAEAGVRGRRLAPGSSS